MIWEGFRARREACGWNLKNEEDLVRWRRWGSAMAWKWELISSLNIPGKRYIGNKLETW
jgi:hypothetical protein